MEVCLKLDNIKLENRPYTEVSFLQTERFKNFNSSIFLYLPIIFCTTIKYRPRGTWDLLVKEQVAAPKRQQDAIEERQRNVTACFGGCQSRVAF